jgi:hypothetical protein
MENLNLIKKKIKYLSKNLNKNYFELLNIYKSLIVDYYSLKKNESIQKN